VGDDGKERNLAKHMEIRKLMEIHRNPWKSMEIHGNPWKSLENYGIPWKTMKICGNQWKSNEIVKIYGAPRNSAEIHKINGAHWK